MSTETEMLAISSIRLSDLSFVKSPRADAARVASLAKRLACPGRPKSRERIYKSTSSIFPSFPLPSPLGRNSAQVADAADKYSSVRFFLVAGNRAVAASYHGVPSSKVLARSRRSPKHNNLQHASRRASVQKSLRCFKHRADQASRYTHRRTDSTRPRLGCFGETSGHKAAQWIVDLNPTVLALSVDMHECGRKLYKTRAPHWPRSQYVEGRKAAVAGEKPR